MMKQIDKSQDISGMADPQNVNLLPFQDLSRQNQQKHVARVIDKQNHDLEFSKRKVKQEQCKQKLHDREQQEKLTSIAKEMESSAKLKRKLDNQSVMEYWKEQQTNKDNQKRVQRHAEDVEGKEYIKWVNNFDDTYNKERFKIFENTSRKSLNQNGNPSEVELPSVRVSDHSSGIQTDNNPIENGFNKISLSSHNGTPTHYKNGQRMSHIQLREKFKQEYVKELNQQLEEKKIRKQKEKQMDPIDKQINQQYISLLLQKKLTDRNPILNISGNSPMNKSRSVNS